MYDCNCARAQNPVALIGVGLSVRAGSDSPSCSSVVMPVSNATYDAMRRRAEFAEDGLKWSQRELEQILARMPELVPREQYEDMKERALRAEAELTAMIERFGTVTTQVIDLKRAERGLAPAGFEAAQVTSLVGRRTEAAIEEFSAGDPELRRLLIAKAVQLTEAAKADKPDRAADDIDGEVAERIRAGDTE